jgi:predicted AlkP superfamily pyrophosphatase or phosphodiesterase
MRAPEIDLRIWLLLLLFAATAALANGSGGINAPEQRDKPYVILVSIDGFRWDYQDLADTPALDRIASQGVRAERMIPVFPTLTFPNHYSIATGLYPANHGIVGNYFPDSTHSRWYALSNREAVQDGSWYRGEPVWVAAEKSGMVTAAYFFVGTEANVAGVPLTYWNTYDEHISGESRVDQVLAWLAMPGERRPHFITLYFEHVDEATHAHGPETRESIGSIETVDGYLGRLLDGIDALPIRDEVYVVVVSDHGQMTVNKEEPPFIIDEVVDIEGLRVVDHGSSAFIYFPEKDPGRAIEVRNAVNAAWNHGRAYLREELPGEWHVPAESGFAEVILQADPGYPAFSTEARINLKPNGSHGWAPDTPEMHAIFLASGPRLPESTSIGPIDSVDVYPLLMEILGLPITTPIDGDPSKLVPLLR